MKSNPRTTTKQDLERIDLVFHDLRDVVLDIFKNSSWEVLVIENIPVIDVDNYEFFSRFFKIANEKTLNVHAYPPQIGDSFVRLDVDLKYEDFADILEEYDMPYLDTVVLGDLTSWGLHVSADFGVMIFGYDSIHSTNVNSIFCENENLLSEDKVQEIYNRLRQNWELNNDSR